MSWHGFASTQSLQPRITPTDSCEVLYSDALIIYKVSVIFLLYALASCARIPQNLIKPQSLTSPNTTKWSSTTSSYLWSSAMQLVSASLKLPPLLIWKPATLVNSAPHLLYTPLSPFMSVFMSSLHCIRAEKNSGHVKWYEHKKWIAYANFTPEGWYRLCRNLRVHQLVLWPWGHFGARVLSRPKRCPMLSRPFLC